jgi:hypothetical protein
MTNTVHPRWRGCQLPQRLHRFAMWGRGRNDENLAAKLRQFLEMARKFNRLAAATLVT